MEGKKENNECFCTHRGGRAGNTQRDVKDSPDLSLTPSDFYFNNSETLMLML